MSEWDASGIESSSSFENIGRPFEKPGCLSETSRNSGLLVTIPELIRNIAPMRYGLLAEEFYKSGRNPESVRSIENERSISSSSLSKLFGDDDDEIRQMSCQCESLYMRDKFCLLRNSSKCSRDENSYALPSKLFDKEEDVSECYSKISKIGEVPMWEPTSNLFHDTGRKCARNNPVFSGRKVHGVIFSPILERGTFFTRMNRISTCSLASYRRISKTSSFFDQFRYQRIPRATARRFLIDRDPKYKAKYG